MNTAPDPNLTYDLEAEKALIGCMLSQPGSIPLVLKYIKHEQYFYDLFHQQVFSIITELYNQSFSIGSVSYITVRSLLKQKKIDFDPVKLFSINNDYMAPSQVSPTCATIVNRFIERNYFQAQADINKKFARGEAYGESLLKLTESAHASIRTNSNIQADQSISDHIGDALQMISDIKDGKQAFTPTGIRELDYHTMGLEPGNLIVVAGRPGMGKTSFAYTLAVNVAKIGRKTSLYSLELNETETVTKLICLIGNLDYKLVLKGEVPFDVLNPFADTVASLPIFIRHNPGIDLQDLCHKITHDAVVHGVKEFIIDQLNFIALPKAHTTNDAVGIITRTLKILAAQLGISIVLLHQLNREVEKRPGCRPAIYDLRDSGNIEQDANKIWLLYRPEYYDIRTDQLGNSTEGKAEIIYAKNRFGETGSVWVRFNTPSTLFSDKY